jgi:LCP family protein required for cell wall assembly
MDRSRFKQRETQKIRKNTNANVTGPAVAGILRAPYTRAAVTKAERPTPVTTIPVRLAPLLPVVAPAIVEPIAVEDAVESIVVSPPSAPMRRISGFAMNLPGETAEGPVKRSGLKRIFHHRAKKPRSTIKTWALRSSVAVLVLMITGSGLVFATTYGKVHKVFKGTSKTVASLSTTVDPDLLKGEGSGRINILLLGRGGGTHDGPDLTDTMMLDSIDPVNHTAVEISIPRDLWVNVPGSGDMKINAAWETGEFNEEGKIAPGSTNTAAIEAGFNQADQTVESVLGVTIDYNVIIDFQAFQQAVDTLGGITVNVPTDLVDPTMAWQNGNNPVLAKAGIDTFNGEQALNYVRSRETTSDFARALRQRAMLQAIKTKVDTLGTLSSPSKISGLLNAFGNNVATDMSLTDATRLYSILKDVNDANTTSVGLADAPNNYITTTTLNGQSVDEPTAGQFDYNDIQAYVRTQLPDGHLLKENAKVLVLNGTLTPGVATTASNTLKSYGYNVVGAANTPTSGYTQTEVVDLSNGKDPYTRHYLEQRYDVTAQTSLPDKSIQTNGAQFVIIIGTDEATSPEN